MAILLRDGKIEKSVMDLIYAKQLQFKQEKQRHVSLDKTVERLIKEAYLKQDKTSKTT